MNFLRTWIAHHFEAAASAWQRLRKQPVNTLLGALVLGIGLSLPAGGMMILNSVLPLMDQVSATPQLSVFLKLDAEADDIAQVRAALELNPQTRQLRFVSREDALKRMQARRGMAEVLTNLPGNPFPDAFIVTPHTESPDTLENLRMEFARISRVEHVQLDSAWARQLEALVNLIRLTVAFLAALLGIALVASTFNTIRLLILTRREEIEVSRLLGATDGYIRRPFYYFGALQGLSGGLIAWLIVLTAYLIISPVAGELARLYGVTVNFRMLSAAHSGILLGVAAGLGWLGAWISLGRHLREAK